ncbi:T9SS type A sorting domain-containing protein [Fulvivirgaceae bacterium BMA12]|uniref:T9SS type A sorting domain-containing protein n=1 Tax=Agaribacillus aureus TaxID=3051825 RepID=A0ABT8L3F4_9BACT|nr:T9SS type A sorting domain-containing protein [Fulvivirgaceae bacterium BMA12]
MKTSITFALLFFTFFHIADAQTQLTDLTYRDGDKSSRPSNFIKFNNQLLFTATTEGEGRELWVSDGTANGSNLLMDIRRGPEDGISPSLRGATVILGGKLFFMANDGENGQQIWSTDGTREGTEQITSLPNLNASKLTLVGNHFFFLITQKNILQVWKSNGTSQGTVLVKDNLSIWNTPSYEGEANNLFFFTFQPSGSNNSRVWRSDGSDSGTFPITDELDGNGAGPGGTSSLTQYIEYNDELYFVVRSSSIFPYPKTVGILKTDGTLENTVPVKAVHEGSSRLVDFADVIEIGDKLYFSFFEVEYRRTFIWESDGTALGTTKIYDKTSPKYYSPSFLNTDGVNLIFTAANNNGNTALFKLNAFNLQVDEIKEVSSNSEEPFIFFGDVGACSIYKTDNGLFQVSVPDNSRGFDGWVSDLTSLNTIKLEELKDVREFISFKEAVYFSGNSDHEGKELWSSDKSFKKINRLININLSKYGLDSREFVSLSDKIFFAADDGISGSELWSYNHTTSSLSLVKDINQGSDPSWPSNPTRIGDHIYFSAYTPDKGRQLWRTDGTEIGTTLESDIIAGEASTRIYNLINHKNKVFFTAFENERYHLFVHDENGTNAIKDLGVNQSGVAFSVIQMVSSDNLLFFITRAAGWDLWRSDGTESGTFKIKDLAQVNNLTPIGDKLFFAARKENQGEFELWYSDGTEAGTSMVKNIGDGYSSILDNFTEFKNQLVFTAYTEEFGSEFWISDGTFEGTRQIADIRPGSNGSVVSTDYTILNDLLYFSANDGFNGVELWRTDGTSDGTLLVSDINQGPDSSYPRHLANNNGHLYFSAFKTESGIELWKSDGTASNTNLLFDLITGFGNSNPNNFTFVDNDLFFVAQTNEAGRQLWTSTGSITGLDDFNLNEKIHIYPNPSSDYIYIASDFEEHNDLEIFDMNGRSMAIDNKPSGRIYVGDLPQGFYILVVNTKNKKVVQKFIKR